MTSCQPRIYLLTSLYLGSSPLHRTEAPIARSHHDRLAVAAVTVLQIPAHCRIELVDTDAKFKVRETARRLRDRGSGVRAPEQAGWKNVGRDEQVAEYLDDIGC